MKLFLFFLMTAGAWAQIERPSLGVMLDENGRARLVTGAPAAAALGDPLFGGAVISLACSQTTCLAKTETAVVASTGETADAPPGAAIIAFIGEVAYVYFVETRQFSIWFAGQLYPFDFATGGDVLSIRAEGFAYAIARDDGIWVGDQNLGQAHAIFLLGDGGALLAVDGQVRLLRADGTEVDFAVSGAGGFLRMSDRYIEVITDSGMWALDTQAGNEQIFLLPGGSR
ncbi:MAG: hypothetical protein M3N41_08750 [Acidobacteriota bacterium]|nr:hypothetical protein [Acidobacteriota bacterium]